eukprot:TRINITY_DN4379_c0_g1_i1.p1 TRINITY_DN4379_c0_g1~~TRINITY_DN4379_c0_g1_i1.p1  ORF type:complete len:325 (+),score=85.16 TRINITY_DN4379_c0_g1_i1:28-1002(+)
MLRHPLTTTTTTTIPSTILPVHPPSQSLNPEFQNIVEQNATQVQHLISEFKKSQQTHPDFDTIVIPENSNQEEKKLEYTLVPKEEVEDLINWIEASGTWSDFLLLTESTDGVIQTPESSNTSPSTTNNAIDSQIREIVREQERKWASQRVQDQESPISPPSSNLPADLPNSPDIIGEKHGDEDDWVFISPPATEESRQTPQTPPEEDVPSFGVSAKLSAVLSLTGQTFMYGYTTGCLYVLRLLFKNLFSDPLKATSVTTLSALGAYWAPQLVFRALGYVVLSGVVSGTVVATPVLIVGTSGVFVSASVFHTYHKLKKMMSKPKN